MTLGAPCAASAASTSALPIRQAPFALARLGQPGQIDPVLRDEPSRQRRDLQSERPIRLAEIPVGVFVSANGASLNGAAPFVARRLLPLP